MPPKKEDIDNFRQKISARKIQQFYRDYLRDKSKLQKKDELLPPKGKVKESEKSTLFHHIDFNESSVLFKKRGWKTLFPYDDKAKKTRINLSLLEFYLNKGIDIRYFVLEAYLRDKIDKHALISLFQLQQACHEFDKGKVKSPIKLFPIHQNGKLTPECNNYLNSYLISHAPPFAAKNKSEFVKSLSDNLSHLPEVGNFFAILDIPINEVYKIAYYILKHVTISKGIFSESGELRNAKNFFSAVAKLLKVQLNVDDPLSSTQLQYSFMEELEKKLISIINQEGKVKITKNKLENYMDDHETLFSLIVKTSLTTTGEFIPVPSTAGNSLTFSLPIIGSETQDAWLKAATGKEPKEVVEKIPMLGLINVQSLHQMTEHKQRPVGLIYEGLPAPDEVHDVIATKYAYPAHDMRFHYPALFSLLAHAEPLYDMQLMFVDTIRKTTGHQVSHIVVNILDFANAFYYDQYRGIETTNEQLAINIFIPEPVLDQRAAALEYAFIVVCDIIKNPEPYMGKIQLMYKKSDDKSEIQYDFLIQKLLEDFISDEFSFQRKLAPYINAIKEYSYSLGTFMCLLVNQGFDDKKIIPLCEKLHKLEQAGLITFKWNKKDGIMLNIDKESYRFRGMNKKLDYRYDNKYPADELIRKVSSDKNFLKDLERSIDERYRKIDALSNKLSSNPK